MPIADDPGRLVAPLASLALTPMGGGDDDDELLLIGSKLLDLTHELLDSPPPLPDRPSILDLTPPPSPVAMAPSGKKPVVLPMELVCLALDFVNPRDQLTFAAASKVCRQWYFAASSYL